MVPAYTFIVVHQSPGNCFHSLLLPGEGRQRLKPQSVRMYQPCMCSSDSSATHHLGGLRLIINYKMLELTALIFPNCIFTFCPPGRHLRSCFPQCNLRKCVFVQQIKPPVVEDEESLLGVPTPAELCLWSMDSGWNQRHWKAPNDVLKITQ